MAKLRINILDDGEYLNLHKKVKVSEKELEDSLGFADQSTGNAYIRQTGVDGIDEATIMHEVSELLADESNHEDANGFRWKKWGKPFRALTGTGASQKGTIFGNTLPTVANIGLGAIPGIGPALATGYGAYRGSQEGGGVKGGLLGALTGYGLGNVGPAIKGGIGGAMAGTGLMKGASEGLNSYGLNPMISKALGLGSAATPSTTRAGFTASGGLKDALLPQAVAQPTLNSVPGALTSYGAGVGSANIYSALSKSNIFSTTPTTPTVQPTSQVPDITTPTTNLGATVEAAPKQTGLQKVLSSIASPLAQTLLGAGTTAASTLPKNAEFENVASLEQLRNEIATNGSSPALYTRAKRALEEGYTDARTELDTIYNQAGMIDSGEYRDAVAKLETKKADANELLAAQIDEQTLNDLLGLTNMEVNIAAAKYGADANDISTLRQILGTAGGTMLSSGLKGLGVTQ
jgi:hypothetical protein